MAKKKGKTDSRLGIAAGKINRETGRPSTRESSTKGPPKTRARKIGAEELVIIETRVLEGRGIREIARELKVDHTTIMSHLTRTIRPAWREKSNRGIEHALAKLDRAYRYAWDRLMEDPEAMEVEIMAIRRPGSVGWLQQVLDCIREEAKLLGFYAASKVKIEEDEFRVAGMSTEELDGKMMAELMEKIREKQQEREATDPRYLRQNLN